MAEASISDAELEVLKVLWDLGQATVREVEAALTQRRGRARGKARPWAYTTILTLLTRLRTKGYVAHESAGVAHVFKPKMTRDKLLGRGLAELADRVCDGTASPLVHALVSSKKLKPGEIADLRRMLDELEGKE